MSKASSRMDVSKFREKNNLPMMMGPDSAIIFALGWITVFVPIVISPFNSHSLQTMAPGAIFILYLELILLKVTFHVSENNYYDNLITA